MDEAISHLLEQFAKLRAIAPKTIVPKDLGRITTACKRCEGYTLCPACADTGREPIPLSEYTRERERIDELERIREVANYAADRVFKR